MTIGYCMFLLYRYGERLKNVEVRAGTQKGLGNEVVGTFKGPGVTKGEHVIQFDHEVTATFLSLQLKDKAKNYLAVRSFNQKLTLYNLL